MPSRLLAASAAFLLFAALTLASASDLDAVLAKAMDGTQTPALAVLEMRDGKIAQEAVRGVRRNDRFDLAKISDVWATGSDGKPMTAALIAKLVDRGVLSWNTPLSKMLPDLAETMRPEYRTVTLIQLLSHRSGLPQDTSDLAFFATFFTDARSLPQQRLAYISRALTEAPAVAPDSAFSYSNTGFIVAAVIAERATRSSYEDLMRREVFQPLGMASAKFAATHDGQPRGHRAGKPVTAAYVKADDGNPLMFAPAGGELHLSLRDWAQFCLDQMAGAQGHGKLLTAASYHLMQTDPHGGNAAVGWGVQDAIGGRKGPVLLHLGSDANWYAVVVLFPKSGTGALVAANAADDMGGDKAVTAALGALLPNLSPAK
ncbi:serine hydrolase domain-containing protein [Dokdonella soli]|uniref:Serine hydrolase domain-containing protein n=1 Tax=Dokdonella soli TaxID=529810 RepID=A0ABP3TIS5_9GAMM